LRSAIRIEKKSQVIPLICFSIRQVLDTLFTGLLRWCSNQSPGPGAVP